MRRVVTGGDLTQQAMRPSDLLTEYLALFESDVRGLGLLNGARAERPCPACAGRGREGFDRLGFTYRTCEGCGTLFVSPLPHPATLDRYHAEGRAERFWRDQVLAATADVRSRHALGPRAQWVAATAAARLGAGLTVGDLGSRDPRILEFLATSPVFAGRVAVAGPDLRASGIAPVDVVTAFETFERAPDLDRGLAQARALLRGGGLLFASTLCAGGFEVRLLGGRLRSLVPLLHLQLLSRGGWERSLGRAGFRLVEYSTPGELDVQAVAEACRRDPALTLPPIVDELVRHEDAEVRQQLQELLQRAGLSAHVQFVAVAVGA